MWIKELPSNYLEQASGRINLNGLWNEGNVYVMDNHRAAAWCWLDSCNRSEYYHFLHIDQHSDLTISKGEVYGSVLQSHSILLDEYLNLRLSGSNSDFAFTWDNYIRPIYQYYPNWFSEAYFAYTQPFDIDEHDKKWSVTGYKGFEGKAKRLSSEELLDLLGHIPSIKSHKWIINLDIDFFFAKSISAKGDSYIDEFARLLNACMPRTQVLTIALSPSCCKGRSVIGGWRNAIRVFSFLNKQLPCLDNCVFKV